MVGVTLGAITGFLVTARLAHRGAAVASLTPIVSGFLGAAAGILAGLPLWTAPALLGEKYGFFDDDPREPWSTGDWIAYYLPYWLPALLGILGIVALVVTAVLVARGRRRAERMSEVLERATKVGGTLTETVATGVEILGQPRIRFTATFTDSAGVQRWVTKTGLFPPAGVPRAGDPAVVWFDPLNPGDETSIIVGVGPDAAAEAGA